MCVACFLPAGMQPRAITSVSWAPKVLLPPCRESKWRRGLFYMRSGQTTRSQFFQLVLSWSNGISLSTSIFYTLNWFHGLLPLNICHVHSAFAALRLMLIYNIKRTDLIVMVQMMGCHPHMPSLPSDDFKTAGKMESNTKSETVPSKENSLSISIHAQRWYCSALYSFPSLSFQMDAATQCSTTFQCSV